MGRYGKGMTHINRWLFLPLFLASTSAPALDPADEAALKETQALLNSPAQMEKLGATEADAGKALEQVKKMTNNDPKKAAELNAISSAIFEDMVKSSNGDSAGIEEKLQQALKDPKAFMNSLPADQQQRLRGLASEIDKENAAKK